MYCLNVIIVLFLSYDGSARLEVSTEEIQTLNEDLRPVWDTEGMTCPVAKYPSHQTQLKTFRSYMIHWSRMHVSTKKLFKCSSCKKIIQAKHKAQHGRQHTENIEFSIVTVINKEYIDPESCVPAKLLKNTETPQKPLESPRKISQRKRKLDVQKSLQNTTILSENLDPDVYNSRDEKLYFFEFDEKTTVSYHKNPPLGQKCACGAIEYTEVYYILK